MYYYQPPIKKDNSGLAITSFVLGLVGLITWLVPICGFPMNLLGVIFGAMSLKSQQRGLAIAGLVMSIIGIVATITNSILGVALNLNQVLNSTYY